LGVIVCLILFLFIGKKEPAGNITWGVNFSSKQAKDLGFNVDELYYLVLDDLKASHIKIAVHWDMIEKEKDVFEMEEIDFLMNEALLRDVQVILAIGLKTPRWPEFHIPLWAKELNKERQQEEILEMLAFIVERYKDYPNLIAWQVENEPFLRFGKAPWKDDSFIKKEIDVVKSIDNNKEIIVTDSGEMSFWFRVAQLSDVVGITMYTKVWSEIIKNDFYYPYPSIFYGRKADLIKLIFNKNVWCLELQAEPWGEDLIQNSAFESMMRDMSIERLKHNILYAKNTGLDTFYFWGVEWWYFMKEKYNEPVFLNEVKKLWN